MEDLPFYSSLNETQKALASKIAAEAVRMGISPKLAVSIAYQESRLNPKVAIGGAGEIGIMQVKPTTAQEVGIAPEDLKNPDKNIEAGLRYLKKSLDMSEGNERLAAAGYNAGVNHPFFSPQGSKLPDTTVRYLSDLKSFGAFTPQPAMAAEPPREDIEQSQAETVGGVLGGSLGTAIAAKRAAGDILKSGGRKVLESVGRPQGVPPGPFAAPPGAPAATPSAPPGAPPAAPGGPPMPRATGPGSATFNYAKAFGLPDIEAQKALGLGKESGEVWDLMGKRQQALTNIGQRFPTERYIENPRFGGLMTPEPGPGPKASFVAQPGGLQPLPPRAPISVEPPSKGALERVTSLFEGMLEPSSRSRAIGRAAIRYAAPPLGLYQAGTEIGSAMSESEREKPDYTKMALSGLGALGAIGSMFPATAPIGIPLAVGAPALQYLRERKPEPAPPGLPELSAP